MSIIGSIASGIAQIAGAGARRRHETAMADKTFAHNKAMAQFAHQKNLDMWHLQNQYNTPKEQMERLQQAGLNPNLMYGRGTAAPGNASELPKYQAPKADYTGVSAGAPAAVGSTIASTLQQVADLKIKKNQADLMQQQAITEGQNTNLKEAEALIRQNAAGIDPEWTKSMRVQMGDQDLTKRRLKSGKWYNPAKTMGQYSAQIQEQELNQRQQQVKESEARTGQLSANMMFLEMMTKLAPYKLGIDAVTGIIRSATGFMPNKQIIKHIGKWQGSRPSKGWENFKNITLPDPSQRGW